MKKYFIIVLLICNGFITYACPACEQQQPAFLKGITHGSGPQGNWDYLIVSVTAIIVIATLYFSIKWLIKPGEKEESHIKRAVLNYE